MTTIELFRKVAIDVLQSVLENSLKLHGNYKFPALQQTQFPSLLFSFSMLHQFLFQTFN